MMARTHKANIAKKSRLADWRVSLNDPRWWAVAIVSGFGAYVASSHGLFFTAGVWQIPLFVGCVVGLVALTWTQAALVAGGVMLASLPLLPPALPFTADIGPADYVVALALSASSAAAVSRARSALSGANRQTFTTAASAVLVLWILGNLWLPLVATGLPVRGYGVLSAATLNEVPQPGAYASDDQVYLRVYYLMHQGEPYYASFNEAWLAQSNKPAAPNSVMGYRLPTFYWLWKLLPSEAFSVVYLFLAFCSIGVLSASFIAGQLVDTRVAPLAAVTVAAYSMSVGRTASVSYIDLPAMSVALLGIALFVRARLAADRRTLWAAAGVMALAALTREILVYFIVLAALSALLEAPGKRLRETTPWLVALGVFGLGYTVHAINAWSYLSDSSRISYLRGNLDFAVRALTYYSEAVNGHGATFAALFALGVIGAFASHRRVGWPFAAFATAALVLPMMAMLRIGNITIGHDGSRVNYWGMLVVPLALSLWPVWTLLLGRKRAQ